MNPDPPKGAILIFGWHDSLSRQLGPLARWYEAEGYAVHTVIPQSFRAFASKKGFEQLGMPAFQWLRQSKHPEFSIHAFSNAGFWSAASFLNHIAQLTETERPTLQSAVYDSAPGFPAEVSSSFVQEHAPKAFLPGILARLGKEPRTEHPVLTPVLQTVFGVWARLARAQRKALAASLDVIHLAHQKAPALFVFGHKDPVVEAQYVLAFVDRLERAGIAVTHHGFPDGKHVNHMFKERARYFELLGQHHGFGSRAAT